MIVYSFFKEIRVGKKEPEKSRWEIKYWCNDKDDGTVEKWLDSLTQEQLKSVASEWHY
ncbi:hypothetical protein [Coxiella burnetii]|uniref:Uncharacterized protein n=2 Tax=Coxiella burnetii TaxID=777 RepID=Q83EN2_COXBU|nr:hypothetical protein [Coxiella burnetii]NP_819327.1 hypothetical protein CBU_0283 [Coxiella burnetii RSA 493]AAO89841.1 hypothetical protein CBU_0283 [Coxiella burnetii RSA 493]ABS78477.2 hypothetical protein CBUD_1799 [Coxiella burnetii Dugway 5J108-111]ACJ18999.1 hypothetical protein CbuG_1724 [Coxiella burnetii CbuG_Q212]AML49727.1 hypothetical protein AUR58_11575 [Coxiella burnetii]AML55623.1 hypothetical protein AYM38_10515 [Coxiella burnetii]